MSGPDPVRARLRGLWSFSGRARVLHLSWVAFFLTFVVWFAYAPFARTIQADLGLTGAQTKTLALCNVALTVPARVFVGMALDGWGPRRVFGAILIGAAVPNTLFALAHSFEALVVSRLAVSLVGAGFVVGIRMVSEWFPQRELGTAEGVYGGWGNFGAAAAAFALPTVAAVAGGGSGWRWAIGSVGLVSAAYGLVWLRNVTDTPVGVTYERPRRQGALEVTQPAAVWGLAAMTVPLSAVLALIGWRVWHEGADTWHLGPTAAGLAASGYAFVNLVARPGGGLVSDLIGSRRRALTIVCAGTLAGYLLLATLSPAWPWLAAVLACMACAVFVQAGAGAVCAVLPLVKRRVAGQVTGMAGAYGNIGGIVFLSVGLAASTRVLFLVMAAVAAVATGLSRLMVEPGARPEEVTTMIPEADTPVLLAASG